MSFSLFGTVKMCTNYIQVVKVAKHGDNLLALACALRSIGPLQRGEVHGVAVYLRESKSVKHIHGARCCISEWSIFFRKYTTPNIPILHIILIEGIV